MSRLAIAAITCTVAATFIGAAVVVWIAERPVQWAGPLTGGPR
jgi:hypothetical protein